MDCTRMDLLLGAEEATEPAEGAAVKAHLEACSACRAKQVAFRDLGAELRQLPLLEPSLEASRRARA